MGLSRQDWPQFSAQLITVAGLVLDVGVQVFHWGIDGTQEQSLLSLGGAALVLVGMAIFGVTTTANSMVDTLVEGAWMYAKGIPAHLPLNLRALGTPPTREAVEDYVAERREHERKAA